MPEKTTPRQRARRQTIRDIKRMARRQLATEGSGALSLRAIARELGIVSSAIYRYVPSRDELLTMLIVDAYDGLGEAVEKAEAEIDRADHHARWMAIGRAFRAWSIAHPEEFGLIYGSPVPGYAAPPERTNVPGTRVSLLILRLVTEAERSGDARPPDDGPQIPESLREGFAGVREQTCAPASDDLLTRTMLAWTCLVGLVAFELTSQFRGLVSDNEAHADHQLTRLSHLLGLTA
jgi:AcrR family transcriptional regulator